jgi:hypothetical protein
MGTATVGRLRAAYRLGMQDYYLGGHPLWQVCRAGLQATRKPYILGGLLLLAGYGLALARRLNRPVSAELVAYHQREQLSRLRTGLWRAVGGRG